MIGVFDSGIGGLTVLSSIRHCCPDLPLMYVADTAFAPYGELPAKTIEQRSVRITQWLIDQGCQLIVVACNTATAIAIEHLRGAFQIPIIGVEPGIKPAALNTQSGHVGILATENTVASQRYQKLIERFLPNVEVSSRGCAGLALAIEQCLPVEAMLKNFALPMVEQGADHLVLGCTHYPLVKQNLQRIIPKAVTIIDTSCAVANEVCRRYQGEVKRSQPSNAVQLFTTKTEHQLGQLVEHYPSLAWLQNECFMPVDISQKS